MLGCSCGHARTGGASLSPESTVLYDQFEYVGEPEDFAWVLPIRGQVEVGLATDWILTSFDQATAPVIEGPSVNCGSTDRDDVVRSLGGALRS